MKKLAGARVLIVIQNMSFTYDTRVQNIAHALCLRGYRVRVLCPRYAGDPRSCTVDGVEIRFIRWPDLGASFIAHALEYLCSIASLTLHAAREALRPGFDVIHICNPPDLFFALGFACRVVGKRVVYDQHDSFPELVAVRSGRRLGLCSMAELCTRATIRVASHVLVTNTSTRDGALRRGAPATSVTIVANGALLRRFPKHTSEDPLLVGYLGNMNPQDGICELLEMARCIRFDHGRTDVRFMWVGSGSAFEWMRCRADALALADSVIFAGRQPPEVAWTLLGRCAVAVQPDPPNAFTHLCSMTKAIEYMALRKPVVAFDLVETRRLCGSAAVYAGDSGDPRELARRVLELVDNAQRRHRLGEAGRRRVERSLLWEHVEPSLLGAYAKLALNNRTPTRAALPRARPEPEHQMRAGSSAQR